MLRTIISFAYLLLVLMGCSHTTVARNELLTISQNKSPSDVRTAILKASNDLGWTMKDESINSYLLELSVRSHYLKIRAEQKNDIITFSYEDSRNLNYSKEKNTIHKKYAKWIQNLKQKITKYLNG